eukprot:4377037-Alexandrium_andersonii.AAC.1
MSASLVGSEMCIRDSRKRQCLECFLILRAVHLIPGTRLRKARFASGGVPVSYTHLTLPTICSV